jgi:hypothetical protein
MDDREHEPPTRLEHACHLAHGAGHVVDVLNPSTLRRAMPGFRGAETPEWHLAKALKSLDRPIEDLATAIELMKEAR